jgi:hypothetical protein
MILILLKIDVLVCFLKKYKNKYKKKNKHKPKGFNFRIQSYELNKAKN